MTKTKFVCGGCRLSNPRPKASLRCCGDESAYREHLAAVRHKSWRGTLWQQGRWSPHAAVFHEGKISPFPGCLSLKNWVTNIADNWTAPSDCTPCCHAAWEGFTALHVLWCVLRRWATGQILCACSCLSGKRSAALACSEPDTQDTAVHGLTVNQTGVNLRDGRHHATDLTETPVDQYM
jgi:hypothetical protein